MGARAIGRGAANVVGVEDGTAILYNPGALAKIRGTTVTYNHELLFHSTEFQRATLDPSLGVPADQASFASTKSSKNLFPLLGSLIVTSDFGLDNWTFAAGVYGPNGVGTLDYPDYGPGSFMLTDLEVLLAYYTLGAAWKYKDVFGVGAVVQYADLIKLDYGLVVDATTVVGQLDPLPSPDSLQLVNKVLLKDRTSATGQVGMWYRPHRRVELGFSSRVVPVFLKPAGGVAIDQLDADGLSAKMDLTLPVIARLGARYIHDTGAREWFDLEVDAVYETWSMVDEFKLEIDGTIRGQEVIDPVIPKNWKDTVSVRMGGDFNAIPGILKVRAGGYFETAAAPKNYSNLDFPSFRRGAATLGLSAGYKGVYFTVGYAHIFQEQREVSARTGKVFQVRPLRPCPDQCGGASGVVANAGKFTSSYDMLTFGVDLRFREILAGRRKRRAAKANAARDPAPQPAPRTGTHGAQDTSSPATTTSTDPA